MINTAELGITIQKVICEKYNIEIHKKAREQFNANYNQSLALNCSKIVEKVFDELGTIPTKCLTYSSSKKDGEKYLPHNFILQDGKTLSIRTNKHSDKVAPRVVGQAGLDTFNYHFNHLYKNPIDNKEQIKDIIYKNIHLMLPTFIDYLFTSDYTVWIKITDKNFNYTIIDKNQFVDITFEREKFTFTRNPNEWKESTTLKYLGMSIAEIQIHKNRTFKFRFIMSNIITLLKTISKNNETFGMSAELAICKFFKLEYPLHLEHRSNEKYIKELFPIISKSFVNLPKPIKHTGSEVGIRGKESKSSYDFLLCGNKTLSLKTNKSKICPPEVGQPGAETAYFYFGHLTTADEIDEFVFKKMVYENIDQMMKIYIKHLFDSDYMLWIYQNKTGYQYKIFEKDLASDFVWDKSKFSFTKTSISDWNESNTVKYNGKSIGEFQVHKHRSCFKFRFLMKNLIEVIK